MKLFHLKRKSFLQIPLTNETPWMIPGGDTNSFNIVSEIQHFGVLKVLKVLVLMLRQCALDLLQCVNTKY